jgi:predicted Zn-dependent protease
MGEVETIAYNRDKGIGVTVYIGQSRGHASTADFSAAAIEAAVEKAVAIARYTAADACAGLADPERLARSIPDLDLYHPWALSVDEAITLGCETEAAALAVDTRLTNSEGATVSHGEAEFVYANSQGFAGGYRSSRHHIDCAVIGEDEAEGVMQRDYWYTAARAAEDLEPAASVGRKAGERTARRLGARRLGTVECPVLFEAPEAADLIGSFVAAVSGGALYRKASFLQDSLGRTVFSPLVSIREEPHLKRARGSAPFDNEGVATTARDVVKDGHGDHRQRRRQSQSAAAARRGRFAGALAAYGPRAPGHRTVGAWCERRDRRLLARCGGVLDRGWRDRLPGRGDHHRRQPEGHVPQHRRRRPRCRSPQLAPGGVDSGRAHDGRRRLNKPDRLL